jgi:hypothetical protein
MTFTRSDIDTLLKVEGSIFSQNKSPAQRCANRDFLNLIVIEYD